MTVKYRSTGKEVSERAPVEKSAYLSPRQQRDEAMAQIEQRLEAMEKAPETLHAEAVKSFDEQFPDLSGDPVLLNKVQERYNQRVLEAAQKRELIDWHKELPKIGNEFRVKLGRMTTEEAERSEWFNDTLRSRGLK
jgi:hypothetical protein